MYKINLIYFSSLKLNLLKKIKDIIKYNLKYIFYDKGKKRESIKNMYLDYR